MRPRRMASAICSASCVASGLAEDRSRSNGICMRYLDSLDPSRTAAEHAPTDPSEAPDRTVPASQRDVERAVLVLDGVDAEPLLGGVARLARLDVEPPHV